MGPPPEETLRVLDKYEVIRRIAQGGMGEIFLSRQVGVAGFNRLIILKTLLPELAEDEDIRASFLNEARIGATLNHPNIVAIYEIGEWEGVYFLAMEYVSGGGLDGVQRAAYKKQVGIPRAVSAMIIRDAAMGLDHAHAAKDHAGEALHIVHRDCTPQNLMVRLDGVVKVVDFGIAKAAGSDNRTNAGEVKGKLAYLAPEQIKGIELDGRCDQFALGVVFWELITGRRLFNAPNPIDIFKKILSHDIPTPSALDPSVPPELDAIIMKMLSHERDGRFRRLGDAAREINTWVKSVGGTQDQVALFVKEMIGAETSERTRDLTPSAVKIQGLVPQSRTSCFNCGATNQTKARFCAECGQSIEATGEASRKMIAAATGRSPFERGDASIPASVEGLLGGPMPMPQGMTPINTAMADEIREAAADAKLTMEHLFGGGGAFPAAPAGAQTTGGAHPFQHGSGAMPVAPGPGSGAYPAAPGSGTFPVAPAGSGAFPVAPAGSGAFPVSPAGSGAFPAAPGPGLDIGLATDIAPQPASALWVGRRDVLMEVGKMVREVASGRIGALVLAGDHGSGRSASLRKCANLARAARLRVVTASGRHFGPRRSLDVVKQLLGSLAGCKPNDRTAILRHLGKLKLKPATMLRLETALGGEQDPQVLFKDLVHFAVLNDFITVFQEEARREGLCIVVDDLHWADAASRSILDAAVSSKASVPLAVLAGASLRFDTAQMPRMELGPLLDSDIQQLLDDTLGNGGLPANARAAVVSKARGIPGFALDLLEVLRFEGAIHNMSGSWVTTDNFEALALPPNPNFFIMNRLRALSREALTMLKAAAAVGMEFSTDFVAAASRKSGDVKDAIAECVAAQLIEQVDHGVYRFVRSIDADVALMMCEGAEEREVHQRLYKAMAGLTDDIDIAADAAGHLLQGDVAQLLAEDGLGARVARHLDRKGLLAGAARLWTATLQGAADDKANLSSEPKVQELLELAVEGVATVRRHQASEAIHVATRILDAAPPGLAPIARASLILERARGLAERLKENQAENDLDAALELLPPEGHNELRSALLGELGIIMGSKGDWAGAALQLESCVRSMKGDQDDVAERMSQLAVAYRHVDQGDKALFAITKARELADAGGDPGQRTLALLAQADVLAGAGDREGARACVEAVEKIAEAQGDTGALVRCLLCQVEVERCLKEPRRAEELRRRAIALASLVGWKQVVLQASADAPKTA